MQTLNLEVENLPPLFKEFLKWVLEKKFIILGYLSDDLWVPLREDFDFQRYQLEIERKEKSRSLGGISLENVQQFLSVSGQIFAQMLEIETSALKDFFENLEVCVYDMHV